MLAERMLADEPLELGNELRLPSEREIRVDALLERGETLFLESDARGSRERHVELGEGRPAPQRKRLAQQLGRLGGWHGPRRRHQPLEALEVELAVSNPDQVAGRLRDDHLTPDGLA